VITFLGTQDNMYEIIIALFKSFISGNLLIDNHRQRILFVTLRLNDLDHIASYQDKYEKFLDEASKK
jgi:hypothetical protein